MSQDNYRSRRPSWELSEIEWWERAVDEMEGRAGPLARKLEERLRLERNREARHAIRCA